MYPDRRKITRNLTMIRSYYLIYFLITLLSLVLLTYIYSIPLLNSNFVEEPLLTFIFICCIFFIGSFFYVLGCYNFIPILAKGEDKDIVFESTKYFFLISLASLVKDLILFAGLYEIIVNNDINKFIFFRDFNFYFILATIFLIQVFYYFITNNFENLLLRLSVELEIKSSSLLTKSAIIEIVGYAILLFTSFIHLSTYFHTQTEFYENTKTETIFYEIFNVAWEEILLSVNYVLMAVALSLILSIYFLKVIIGYKLRNNLIKAFIK